MDSRQTTAQIFISYSHKDKVWLERLRAHLKPLEFEGLVQIWDDTELRSGSKWREEIKKAIDSARIAILLISADFLASDFVVTNELPPLLAAAQEKGTRIFPLIIRPSSFQRHKILSEFQAVNSPLRPLNSIPEWEYEQELVNLAIEIEETLKGFPPALSEAQTVDNEQSECVLSFIEDLIPDDTSIRNTYHYLDKGGTKVYIKWSSLNNKLFQLATDIQPELQQRFRSLGIRYGDEMDSRLAQYYAALSVARRYRDNAARRVVALWKGMQEELSRDYFVVPALRHFLILVNLGILMRLHSILEEPAGISPIFYGINANPPRSRGESGIFNDPVIRELLGVEQDEVFWGVRFNTVGLSRLSDRNRWVWAPKDIVIDAYRLRWEGEYVTNGFIQKFAVPQVETDLLYDLDESNIDAFVIYRETAFSIEKVRDKFGRELKRSDILGY